VGSIFPENIYLENNTYIEMVNSKISLDKIKGKMLMATKNLKEILELY
jgi:transcription initiation factor IIE alpha subunit